MEIHKIKNQLKSGARFYLDREINKNETIIELPREIMKHATSSLRLKEGAFLSLFDKNGREYLLTLVATTDGIIKAKILQLLASTAESILKISLTQSILSNEKMNLVIQKATELGIAEINIFKAKRSSIKINMDQLEKKKHHWYKVAVAACEQSGRTRIPKIKTYLSLESFLEQELKTNAKQTKFMLAPNGSTCLKDIKVKPINMNIIIGPEGGFSEDELATTKPNDIIEVRLGPRTLRSETAGISMIAIAQALWGDF